MLSGLTSVAFSCERCWGHWSQSHRRITLALHLTHSLLHLQRRRKEREESEDVEWKEGGREREEQGWREKREKESTIKRLTILFTVSFVND